MSLRSLALAGMTLAVVGAGGGTAHAGPCPVLAAMDPNHLNGACNLIVTFNADGSIATGGMGGNYDGSDDALIGVVNNTATPISMFGVSGPGIFGFDGDGVDAYISIAGNSIDTSGYGGANAYFTSINASLSSGTVNFITPIAASGGTSYFSLESQIDLAAPPVIVAPTPVPTPTPTPTTVPEPLSLALIGSGLASLAFARRRHPA